MSYLALIVITLYLKHKGNTQTLITCLSGGVRIVNGGNEMAFHDKLKKRKILVSDGGWGTELANKGFGGGSCPEILNVDEPDVIRELAQSYVDAGSDIILTNTFGGNPFKLARYGMDERLEELNEAGVLLSKEAAGDHVLVFASIGPSGEFLAPLGEATTEEMIEAFARQVRAMVRGGADGIVIESMTDLGEITCALRAAKDYSNLPVACSMTFDKGLKGYATIMGIMPDEAARALEDAGADAVGSNCSSGIGERMELARLLQP